jgi:hypothetical protein
MNRTSFLHGNRRSIITRNLKDEDNSCPKITLDAKYVLSKISKCPLSESPYIISVSLKLYKEN